MKYHSQTISDVLLLIDFPQETSLGRVIDLHVIEGRIPSLVRMVEAGVLCQGALVSLVSLDVLLVPLGGAVVDRRHALAPALQANAGVGGPGPGVRGPLSSALAQVAVRPTATSEVKVDQGNPDLLRGSMPRSDFWNSYRLTAASMTS